MYIKSKVTPLGKLFCECIMSEIWTHTLCLCAVQHVLLLFTTTVLQCTDGLLYHKIFIEIKDHISSKINTFNM